MPKRFIKRYMPDHRKIRDHQHLRFFGERLHDPNLWHLNRRSVAGALGIGVFVAFLPIAGQMVLAAALAVWLRLNLPLSVATVWITNPITMTPMFYFTYRVGTWMLSRETLAFDFQLSLGWLLRNTASILTPLMIGSLFVGILSGLGTYVFVRLAWRLYVIRKHRRRAAKKLGTTSQKIC